MKKIISIIFMTILFFILGTHSFANSPGKITLQSNSVVKPGEEITIKICSTGLTKSVNGLQGKIEYDTNVLEYIGKKSEQETWSITAYSKDTGIFLAEVKNVLETETLNLDEETPIVSFTFKVKDNVQINKSKITVSDIVIAPGTLQIEKKYAEKEIKIVQEQTPDEEQQENQQQNNSNDNTISNENIPHAGINKETISVFIIVMAIMSVSYLGYSKNKDIK